MNEQQQTKPVTQDELDAFVRELDQRMRAEFILLYPTMAERAPGVAASTDIPARGQKYVRIVKIDSGRSAYCFIEIATGNIFKSASWQTPAKHARGNIRAPWWGTALNLYGAARLR